MFTKLVTEASQRLNLPGTTVSALLGGLGALMTSDRTGGISGFVDSFRRAGIGDAITSWYGGRQGKPVTASHVETVLGAGAIQKLAESSGVTRAVASSAIAFLLPKVIAVLTPSGTLPTNESVVAAFTPFTRVVPSSTRVAATRPQARWLPWTAAAAVVILGLVLARNRTPSADVGRAADSARVVREAAGSIAPAIGAAASLQGVTWEWEGFSSPTEQRTIDTPDRYTIRFDSGGRVAVRADCNRGTASYTATADGELTVTPMALTRAMCPPGSMSDRFARDVGSATRFDVRDSSLVLTLPANGGTLRFRKAA